MSNLIQKHQGCGFDFTLPIPLPQDATWQSSQCAHVVMGYYYPNAVWCDRQTFTLGGWRAYILFSKI